MSTIDIFIMAEVREKINGHSRMAIQLAEKVASSEKHKCLGLA